MTPHSQTTKFRWGGARAGAGRPRRGPIASEPHKSRPRLQGNQPVHVTARIARIALARGHMYRALHRALALSFARADFRIVRIGLTRAHVVAPRARHVAPGARPVASPARVVARRAPTVEPRARGRGTPANRAVAPAKARVAPLAPAYVRVELVVEADDRIALARGMQGFQVSAAKSLNRLAHRRGSVFPDRYRMQILRTRAAVRGLLGRLPLARTIVWPQTSLLRTDGIRGHARPSRVPDSHASTWLEPLIRVPDT